MLRRRAAGRHLHALAHNRDAPSAGARRAPPALDRRAAARWAARRDFAGRPLDATLVALIDRGDAGGCARRTAPAGRSCCGALRRLLPATRSHTLGEATAQTETILVTARGLLADGDAGRSSAAGYTLVGVASPTSPTTASFSSCCPSERARDPWTPPSTTSATGSGRARITGPSCWAGTRPVRTAASRLRRERNSWGGSRQPGDREAHDAAPAGGRQGAGTARRVIVASSASTVQRAFGSRGCGSARTFGEQCAARWRRALPRRTRRRRARAGLLVAWRRGRARSRRADRRTT